MNGPFMFTRAIRLLVGIKHQMLGGSIEYGEHSFHGGWNLASFCWIIIWQDLSFYLGLLWKCGFFSSFRRASIWSSVLFAPWRQYVSLRQYYRIIRIQATVIRMLLAMKVVFCALFLIKLVELAPSQRQFTCPVNFETEAITQWDSLRCDLFHLRERERGRQSSIFYFFPQVARYS